MRSSPIYPVLFCSLYQLPRNSLSSPAPFNGSSEFVVWLTLRDSSIFSSVTALCHPNPMHSLNVWSSVHTIYCPCPLRSSLARPFVWVNINIKMHPTPLPPHRHDMTQCIQIMQFPFVICLQNSDALEWWRQLSSISLVIILLHKVVKNYH